jgi:hypothetical protein
LSALWAGSEVRSGHFDGLSRALVHSFNYSTSRSLPVMLEPNVDRTPSDAASFPAEPVLATARLIDGEVEVTWSGRWPGARFAPFWLRDHCHAKESLHPETLQRQVDTFSIPAAPRTHE